MRRLLSEARRRKRNQKGFTLIEMLVVISILGILAAIVTMSMVGITNTARQNAEKAEKQTIQVAMDTMAAENGLQTNQVCPGPSTSQSATKSLNQFPELPADYTGAAQPLYPRYIRIRSAQTQAYWCDADGTVHGTDTDPASPSS